VDQSGGSTPNALRAYGIKENAWANDEQMFALVHQMRTRIITSPSFTGSGFSPRSCSRTPWTGASRGAHRRLSVERPKRIVAALKVTKAWSKESAGVQLMKPMPELGALLERAKAKRMFGTKMRSVVKQA